MKHWLFITVGLALGVTLAVFISAVVRADYRTTPAGLPQWEYLQLAVVQDWENSFFHLRPSQTTTYLVFGEVTTFTDGTPLEVLGTNGWELVAVERNVMRPTQSSVKTTWNYWFKRQRCPNCQTTQREMIARPAPRSDGQ